MPARHQGENPFRALLLDADAFINLRTLSIGSNTLLVVLLRRAKEGGRTIYLTQYVAEHDLSDLQEEIASWKSEGLIKIEKAPSSDRTYRQLRREIHKGEAEAIAWSVKSQQQDRPLFVARDRGALDRARKNKIPSTDLM